MKEELKDLYGFEEVIMERKIIMDELTSINKESVLDYLKLYPLSSLDYVNASEYVKIRRVNYKNNVAEQLFRLFEVQNIDLLSILVDLGADINIVNSFGFNALLNCADNELSIKKMKVLINKGINIDQCLEDGKNALFRFKNMQIIKLLMDANIDYHVMDKEGKNFLFYQKENLIEIDNEFSKTKSDFNPDWHIQDNDGNSLLHTSRDLKELEFLISKGLNVNAINNEGETFIWNAKSVLGTKEYLEKIIASGLDINIKNKAGKNFLECYVCKETNVKKMTDMADNLKSVMKKINNTAYNSDSHFSFFQKYIEKNTRSQYEIVKYLVENGADVSFMGKNIYANLTCNDEIKTYLENVYLNKHLKITPNNTIKSRI